MARGPLPNPDKVRRNVPTIPTTNLPAGGRTDPAPPVPASFDLAEAGRAWWVWAWSRPQASGWSSGDEYLTARRASLEDDLAACVRVETTDLMELTDQELRVLVGRLAALVTGRMTIMREIRELDDRLGLSPKGMAALRWKIVASESSTTAKKKSGSYAHLRAV